MKQVGPWLLLLLSLGAFKGCYDRQQQAIGRRDAGLRALTQHIVSLQHRGDSLRTELARRVPVAVRTKIIWDTLPPLVPALQVPSATPIPAAQVAQIILIGQEAVQACHSALSVCQALVPVQDSIITAQREKLAILARQIPNQWDRLREWGIRVGLVYLTWQVVK